MASLRGDGPLAGDDTTMRAFVCSYLDDDTQRRCAAVIAELVETSRGLLRSVPAGTAHLTYAFIASLPDDRLPQVEQALVDATAGVPSTAMSLGAPEILYGGSEARLVHLPVTDGRDALEGLARTIAGAVQRAVPDVAVSATPSPHVTLARFRRGTRRRDARPVQEAIAHEFRGMQTALTVERVQIMESRLGARGPSYVVRAEVMLGPPA